MGGSPRRRCRRGSRRGGRCAVVGRRRSRARADADAPDEDETPAATATATATATVAPPRSARNRAPAPPAALPPWPESPGVAVTTEDGLRLHAEVAGDPDAPVTLIFVHGYGLSRRSWRFQRRDLADGDVEPASSSTTTARTAPPPAPPVAAARSISSARTCSRWSNSSAATGRWCWSATRWAG